eukprot:6191656-Pleurochrysis_carterae.AAC.2
MHAYRTCPSCHVLLVPPTAPSPPRPAPRSRVAAARQGRSAAMHMSSARSVLQRLCSTACHMASMTVFLIFSNSLLYVDAELHGQEVNGTLSTAPNFVLILGDDWGYGDMSLSTSPQSHKHKFSSNSRPKTPNLARMAAHGTAFNDFHVLSPECSPSRASFLTGRSPGDPRVRLHAVTTNSEEDNLHKCGMAPFLDPKLPTVMSVLQRKEYAVGHFGKWHVGLTADAPPPEDYGIDSSKTFSSRPKSNKHAYSVRSKWWPSNSSRQIIEVSPTLVFSAPFA